MKIRVAIAEDNNVLAMTIQEKLELFAHDIDFRYRACNGIDLLSKLKADKSIDVILMDIEMPDMNGIDATEIISVKFPQIKIIMLTVFDDDTKIFRSIQAGANGYLLKEESPDRIIDGIKMIMNGGAPMSPTIAAKSLELLRNPNRLNDAKEDASVSLSKREIEVLEQLSQGLAYKEIAANLFISPFTVRKHIENIYKNLHVNNKMKAVQTARKHNII
ncbi:response regulator transcription factor [candidate division KSB1 bacterium]|nr:response regulator transcription factor [candidate division KSB1 bacterium]